MEWLQIYKHKMEQDSQIMQWLTEQNVNLMFIDAVFRRGAFLQTRFSPTSSQLLGCSSYTVCPIIVAKSSHSYYNSRSGKDYESPWGENL